MQFNNRSAIMHLLSLLLLALVAIGIATTVPEKVPDNNNVAQQVAADNKSKADAGDEDNGGEDNGGEDNGGDKKVAKRSYGWNPWIYSGYSYGWPWYGYGGGHGWYPWFSGWPYYGHGYGGGYFGYRGYGGWYKGW